MLNKICSRCKVEKNILCFYSRSDRKSGKMSHCKDCCHQYNLNMRKVICVKDIIVDGRVCSICRIYKSSNLFWKSKYTSDGLYSSCKECKSKAEKSENRRMVRNKYFRDKRNDKIRKYTVDYEKNAQKRSSI